MKQLKLITWQRLLLASVLVASTTQSFGFKQGMFNLSAPNHQDITADAVRKEQFAYTLNNFKPVSFSWPALTDIQAYNASTDNFSVHFWNAEFHFDEERFSGNLNSIDHLFTLRKAIVDEMRGQSPNVNGARQTLGFALHTVQDFYAHSNWVEINRQRKSSSLPPLNHPTFGSSPDYRDVFAGSGLDSVGLVSEAPTACVTDGLIKGSKSRLTTGYYDLSMHGIPERDLGFSTTPWKLDAISNFSTLYDPVAVSQWPDDRCVHGGDTGRGLNKDNKARDAVHGKGVFDDAKTAATEATRLFVLSVLDGINEPNPDAPLFTQAGLLVVGADTAARNRGICRLLGHQPETDCDDRAPTQVSVSPSHPSSPYGADVLVVVTGIDLPASTVVKMQNVVCPRNPFDAQSSTSISVLCRPSSGPGNKVINAYQYDGTTTAMAASSVNIEIGLANVLPALTRMLEDVALWFSELWGAVTKIEWAFGGAANTQTVSVVNGTSTTAKTSFNTSGQKTIIATFKDAANAVLGTTTVTVDVLPATVTSVVSPPVKVGDVLTFSVQGSNLPQGLGFTLEDCTNVQEVLGALGIGTAERRFTCTFLGGTAAGTKNGAISIPGSAGNPFSTVLKPFAVNVPASAQPQITAALAVTPNPAVVGDVITMVAQGVNLRGSGFLFKGMDFCGQPIAAPASTTDTELRYSCAATAPTNLIGTVSVVAADTVSQKGSAVIVRVNCPTGQTLDTSAGRCIAASGTIDLPATSFVRGENVALSANGYGADAVMNAPPYGYATNAAEWDFTVPTAGTYELFAEYAAVLSRPVVISFNGVVKFNNALSATTGGWFPADRQLISQGSVQLAAGAITMRVARNDVFPHIKGFKLVLATPALVGSFSVNAKDPLGTTFVAPTGATVCDFSAPGTWSPGNGYTTTADGDTHDFSPWVRLLPTANWMALIAQASGGHQAIGSNGQIVVTGGERYAFMINEGRLAGQDAYADNSGALTVAYTCH